MNGKKFIKGLMESIMDDEDRKVVRTVKATAEEKQLFIEIAELRKAENALEQERKSKKALAWASIEKRLDDYTTSMQWNPKTQEIEILADEEE